MELEAVQMQEVNEVPMIESVCEVATVSEIAAPLPDERVRRLNAHPTMVAAEDPVI